MFGISFEHIIIVGVILLFVGPKRLPELGNTMGKALKNFKDSISGVENASYKKIQEQEKRDVLKKTVASADAPEADLPPSDASASSTKKES